MTAYDRAADALRARFRRQVDALHAEGYMTFDEAAAELGVARYTAQRMVADGRLRVERVDDRLAVRPEWIASVPRSRKDAAAWRRENGWLSTAEAADLAGITPQAMNVRINRGTQPAVRAGADAPMPGTWLIRPEDVERRVA